MRRRKVLAGLGSLAAGRAALMGTCEFDNVQAEGRTVSVNVANDVKALLGLDPNTGQYSELASLDGNGQITVDVSGINGTNANGVNTDAGTFLFDIFRVRNHGKDPAIVYVDPDSVEFGNGTKVANVSSGDDYIDPQATQRSNGGDATDLGPAGHDTVSLAGVYNFPSDPQGFASAADSTYDNERGKGNYRLNSGQEYAFGLYIREGYEDGDSYFPDVSMTVVGDTGGILTDRNGFGILTSPGGRRRFHRGRVAASSYL